MSNRGNWLSDRVRLIYRWDWLRNSFRFRDRQNWLKIRFRFRNRQNWLRIRFSAGSITNEISIFNKVDNSALASFNLAEVSIFRELISIILAF